MKVRILKNKFDENADRCFTCKACILDIGPNGTRRDYFCMAYGEQLHHNIHTAIECEDYERG